MKKRRGSVLWRWTWYMMQPGSLRDSSVSLEKIPDISVSRPTFAIHVTASTTIPCSLGLDFLTACGFLSRQGIEFSSEAVHKNGLLAPRSGGNHADPGSAFLLEKIQILPRCLWQLFQLRDALRRSTPPRHRLVDTLDCVIAAGVRWDFRSCLAIDLVSDAKRNLG